MRRVGLALTALAAVTLLPVSAAYAETPSPSASASAAGPAAGTSVCTITDTGVSGLTGLAAVGDGYAVVTGQRSAVSGNSYLHVYLLGSDCKKKGNPLNFSGNGARDPQDLTVASDGSLWVGDTGDNGNPTRTTIGVWKVPADGSASTLYRMAYPDGQHPDAEAMLIGADGLPLVITKGTDAPAQIYQPTAPLDSASKTGIPMKQVGTFTPQKTNTPSKFGPSGASTVTGANLSADGKKVVIRTLTDAYEWDVTDGNILAAIITDKFRVTPLPNEPSGAAIAYGADGKFLTLSNTTDSATPRAILAYTPVTPSAVTPSGGTSGGPAGSTGGGSTSWFDKLSFTDLTYLIGVVGVIGLLMIVGGALGIKRSRKQQRVAAKRARAVEQDGWDEPDTGYPDRHDQPAAYDERYADRYGDDYADSGRGPEDPRARGSHYGEPVPAERGPARPAGRRPEPGAYPGGGYGNGGGDDFDAGYPESYGSGYNAAPSPAGNSGPDYPAADQRGAEYGTPRRGGGRDSWSDEPTTGRSRAAAPPPEVPVRGNRPDGNRVDPRRGTGRAMPPPPRNTWADEHEGFGDLR